MSNKSFPLNKFAENEGGTMAFGTNSGNMITALVRYKRKAQNGEIFPRFTTDGTDTFEVDGNIFGEQNQRGEKQIHKDFKEFFKNLTTHDFWMVSFRNEDEFHFITKFINMEKRLPADTRAFLDSLPNNQRHNFGFLTQKAAAFKQDKFWYMNEERTGLNHPFRNSKEIEILLAAVNERQAAQLEQLKNQGFDVAELLTYTVKHRLVAGLGVSGVYETGMTLHPVYGIPYLPGSAIKGILRNFIINELFRDTEDKASEARALNDPIFCQWFGCPEKSCIGKALKGRVIFMDAFPQGKITVKPDVMTPHFQKYYMDESNRIPPADWLEPNPVVFLTVEKTKFVFGFAVKKDSPEVWKDKEGADLAMQEDLQDKTFSQLLNIWLPKALNEHGLGAKTAVGYGLFS